MGSTIQWREPPDDRSNRSVGETIEFGKRADAGRGYMAHSERVGPGVLVLHEFFGLQQSFMDYADRLNAAGFTVLAPDLYDGAIAASVDEARTLAQSMDVDATLRKLRAAAAFLTDNWHPRLGVVGFSLGADFAAAMTADRAVDALVLYYGVGAVGENEWRGPTLGHFAANDEWVDLADAQNAFAALAKAGAAAEMHVYPEAGHWFANAAAPTGYREADADLAFDRTTEFLLHHLA